MRLSKLLPLAMMTGIGYTQKDSIETIVQAPMETAKIIRTQMEISSIRQIIWTEVATDTVDPRMIYDFSNYLKSHLASSGNRNVALDSWGQPYQIRIYQNKEYEVWSIGPDGIDDTPDDIWTTVPLP